MGKHYGEAIIKDLLQMKEDGRTNREIADHFRLSLKQIKNVLNRYRRNERKREAGIPHIPKGRPRTRFQTQEEKILIENKQLKMENELLRNFLHVIGRR